VGGEVLGEVLNSRAVLQVAKGLIESILEENMWWRSSMSLLDMK
jgi:hypothetical protein